VSAAPLAVSWTPAGAAKPALPTRRCPTSPRPAPHAGAPPEPLRPPLTPPPSPRTATPSPGYDKLISELGIRSIIAGDTHKAAQKEAAAAAQ
jgi:hypothetical protein